ncbi:serine protein kinase [Aspergillus undulatus]|uniref:serine protein kinase n=1 Tax=Aspergillus undulatus TaxID=1810928 RepID=UPI003CCE21F1
MRRFERIYDVVEPVEEYRRGGYHPVHLHDVLADRYEIIGKLAFGQFSTQVALKILKAEASENNKELFMFLKLSDQSLEDYAGKKHVLELLDHFQHDGPNGTHLCLVLPVMISDGQQMTVNGRPRQAAYVRFISQQILLGIDFLHAQGIIHCDLQPANILVSTIVDANSEMILEPPEFSPVKWLEGTIPDDSAPEYLMPTQRRRGELDRTEYSKLSVKIGDLGGAINDYQCDQKPVTPGGLRAPELIRQKPWDPRIDSWALGCLIFELATNKPLFPLGVFGLSWEEIDEEHLHLINQLFGNENTDRGFVKYLSDRLPPDFGTENIQQLASLLSLMLQIDPRKRASAGDLINHPFLRSDE